MAGRGQETVIDSSVAVKWFSAEEDTAKALAMRDHHLDGSRPLWASDLLYHEVTNALRFKRTYDGEKLSEAINSLFALHLNIVSANPLLLRNASAIAYRGTVTIYDAVPVALAEIRKTVCITADKETQYRKLKAHGYPVALLTKE